MVWFGMVHFIETLSYHTSKLNERNVWNINVLDMICELSNKTNIQFMNKMGVIQNDLGFAD
jgi:hypothetical protein